MRRELSKFKFFRGKFKTLIKYITSFKFFRGKLKTSPTELLTYEEYNKIKHFTNSRLFENGKFERISKLINDHLKGKYHSIGSNIVPTNIKTILVEDIIQYHNDNLDDSLPNLDDLKSDIEKTDKIDLILKNRKLYSQSNIDKKPLHKFNRLHNDLYRILDLANKK